MIAGTLAVSRTLCGTEDGIDLTEWCSREIQRVWVPGNHGTAMPALDSLPINLCEREINILLSNCYFDFSIFATKSFLNSY